VPRTPHPRRGDRTSPAIQFYHPASRDQLKGQKMNAQLTPTQAAEIEALVATNLEKTNASPLVLAVRRQAREQVARIEAANKKGDEIVTRLNKCIRTDPDCIHDPELRAYAETLIYQLNMQTAHLNDVIRLNLSDEEVLCWMDSTFQEAEEFLGDGWLLDLLELAADEGFLAA
jgi:hypothetical protein